MNFWRIFGLKLVYTGRPYAPYLTLSEIKAAETMVLGRWDGINTFIRASSDRERVERLGAIWLAYKASCPPWYRRAGWRPWEWRFRRS
jgi:hypothetical protein